MAGRFSVEAVFKAVDRVTAPVSRMQNRVGKFTRSMNRGLGKLNRSVDKFSGGIKRAGLAVAASMFIVGGAMANVIGTGAEFEQTLVNAAAKFPGEIRKGTEAFKLLEDAARQTGKTTEFTASQAANGLNFLAMAGFNAEQSIAALPGVVDLATAAQIDLATASDIATDTLGAFGLATKDAAQLGINLARVNDVMARTTTSANTDMETMFETIKKGGATATGAGMAIEEFSAMVGIMANAGLKGSEAGSVMKNMVLKLSAPTAAATKILKGLKVETQDAGGNLLSVTDILGDLSEKMKDMGTAEKGAVLDTLFGKRAIVGVQILMKEGAQAIKGYTKELKGATGASGEMASVMRDTLQGRLNSLNSAIEGVKISIFTLSNTALNGAVDKTTEWVRANEELIASNIGEFIVDLINNFESIVTWIKRIGIALGVFIAFTTILKTLVLTMTAFNLVMALNPIGLMVLGVAALVAGLILLGSFIDDIVAGFGNMHPAIRLLYAPLEGIARLIKLIKDGGEWLGGKIGAGLFKMFGDSGSEDEDEQQQGATGPQVVSPQERTAKSIEENTTVQKSEVTIKADQGTSAEQTGGKPGAGLNLQNSGAFN